MKKMIRMVDTTLFSIAPGEVDTSDVSKFIRGKKEEGG
ncbi:hypothetical protein BkAM31D_16465 [Halalkalibacter krulwichiae]|uniref:Uncharacterized protein n=1 Tax=Halalkalibacter krulwichiae TaxID=199441 RepID=A0A1X9MD01_9BACI|nr:hypothetical protein BkAM31D_16465 [Halalkalibacter krulwichiae]